MFFVGFGRGKGGGAGGVRIFPQIWYKFRDWAGGLVDEFCTTNSQFCHDYLISITYINQPKSREYHGFYFWG